MREAENRGNSLLRKNNSLLDYVREFARKILKWHHNLAWPISTWDEFTKFPAHFPAGRESDHSGRAIPVSRRVASHPHKATRDGVQRFDTGRGDQY
jgi:hypothetical protein